MLVVTVEVWPNGNVLNRRVIHTMNLANVSQLADVSNYEGFLDDESVEVRNHKRSDGAWALVYKALRSLGGDTDRVDE